LSCTIFSILSPTIKNKTKETLSLPAIVKDTNLIHGSEFAQVYVAHSVSSIKRPKRELKEFMRVFLASSENRLVEVQLDLKSATSFGNEHKDG
jgi:beta-glucosidase